MVPKKSMPKDLNCFCAQLYASSQAMEEQLRALRAEHEMLCRMLDKAGVVSCHDLKAEMQSARYHKAGGEKDSPMLGLGSPWSLAAEGETPPSRSGLSRGGRAPWSLSSPAPRTGSPPPASGRKLVRSRSQQPAELSEPMGGLGQPRAQQRSKSMRSLGQGPPMLDESVMGQKAPEMTQTLTTVTEPEPFDLYDCMQKLIDTEADPAEQQKASRAFQRAMKNPAEPPNTWSGPGVPLATAVRAGRPDLARALLRARADPNIRDGKGVSPLHLAAFDGSAELCRVLLVARADVDVCDRHHQTPLFFAPTREVCKTLIDRRSDVTMLNRKGQSALHLAGRAGLHDVLEWFQTRVSKTLIDLKDVHGATAKDYARQSGVPRPDSLGTLGSPRGSPRLPSPPPSARSKLPAPTPVQGFRGLATETCSSPRGTMRAPAIVVSKPAPVLGGGGGVAKAAPPTVEPAPETTSRSPVSPVADSQPSSRGSPEHFEICDATEAQEVTSASRMSSEAKHLEHMYDSLGLVNEQEQGTALEAAAGLAAAAVATAVATTIDAAQTMAQEKLEEAAPVDDATLETQDEGPSPGSPDAEVAWAHRSSAKTSDEERPVEEEEDKTLADLGIMEDESAAEEDEVLNADGDEDEDAAEDDAGVCRADLAAMGIMDSGEVDLGNSDNSPDHITMLEDELDEVF